MNSPGTSKKFQYTNEIRWKSARLAEIDAKDKPPLQISSPPEFRGAAGYWTPEDLFVASANACLMLTFLSAAEREHIVISSYESSAAGLLDRIEDNFRFSTITIEPIVELEDSSFAGRVREMFREAEVNCLIGNSIKAALHVQPRVLSLAY